MARLYFVGKSALDRNFSGHSLLHKNECKRLQDRIIAGQGENAGSSENSESSEIFFPIFPRPTFRIFGSPMPNSKTRTKFSA